MAIPRQVAMHVGTHKTGTTALQLFLSTNWRQLREVGLHYPNSARIPIRGDLFTPGHHLVPNELLADGVSPSFDKMLDEIDAVNAPTILLSSEELQYLANHPNLLATIADAFSKRGYSLHPIVYFRAQPYYAESLFVELTKGGYVRDLNHYFEEILTTGTLTMGGPGRTLIFDYARIVDGFDRVLGPGRTVVRAYRADRESEFIFNDFLRTVGHLRGTLHMSGLDNPEPRVNQSLPFASLLVALHNAVVPSGGAEPLPYAPEWFAGLPELPEAVLASRFSLLTHCDLQAFLDRYGEGNRALNERFGIDIPFRTRADLPSPGDAQFALSSIHREYIARAMDKWSST